MNTELAIGTVLSDRYEIVRVIGIGGFGITYEARHINLGYTCAIKEFFISGKCVRANDGASVIFQDLQPEMFDKYRTRFMEEAQTLAKLDNRHVVRVRDVFQACGTAYIVMDFIQGETLSQRIQNNGALSFEEAVNIIAQLSEAVEYIHEHHILHRDIKPDNVMITNDNNVVLIDFGSARSFVNDEVQNHTAILTMGYAPIEQYTSTSKKGNYTDIYSLGGVLYFALTGQKPVEATERVLEDTLVAPQQLNPSIPAEAGNTIMKALNMKPEERYQTVAEFRHDLIGEINTTEPINNSIDETNDSMTTIYPQPQPKPKKNLLWLWLTLGIGLPLILIFSVVLFLSTPAHFSTDYRYFISQFEDDYWLELNKSGYYEIKDYPYWVNIENQNSSDIHITLDDNYDTEDRSGTISIVTEGWFSRKYCEMTLVQSGNTATYLNSSRNTIELSYNGATRTDTIYSDGLWVMESKPSWVSLALDNDNKNVLHISADVNHRVKRSGTIKLVAADETHYITVNQGGEVGSYLSVSPDYTTFNANGDARTFYVNCDGKWEIAVGTYSWGHLTENHNNNTITVSLDYNPGSAREDYFVVKTGSKRARVDYKQY